MPIASLDVLQNSLQKTNELLNEIEEELGWQNRRHQTYEVLRAFLHTLRDRLPADIAVKFAAQLPIVLKGVFYDNWQPELTPIKWNADEFVIMFECRLNNLDFEEGPREIIRLLSQKVFSKINPEESGKIFDALPNDIVSLLI